MAGSRGSPGGWRMEAPGGKKAPHEKANVTHLQVWKNLLASGLTDLSKHLKKVSDRFIKTKQKILKLLLTTRKINNCGGKLNI